MNAGDVVLVPIPQSNGQVKNRPVVLLKAFPPYGDFLACGISSQLQRHVAGFDDLVSPNDGGFSSSGLKKESAIRLGFLCWCRRLCRLARLAPFRRNGFAVSLDG
jgi:mRNA interferase MazF